MKKLLFIGNSHTYFHDMPEMAARLFALHTGEDIFPVMLTKGGMTLRWHFEQEQTIFNIRYGHYDYVVLQQATHPFDGKEALLRQAKPLLSLIRESGAVPVAYMTWAKRDTPADQAELTEAFQALARQENTLLAPAGVLWEKMQKAHPEAELYSRDGAHASALGSYLAAVSIFSAITGMRDFPYKTAPSFEERGLDAGFCQEIHRLCKEAF